MEFAFKNGPISFGIFVKQRKLSEDEHCSCHYVSSEISRLLHLQDKTVYIQCKVYVQYSIYVHSIHIIIHVAQIYIYIKLYILYDLTKVPQAKTLTLCIESNVGKLTFLLFQQLLSRLRSVRAKFGHLKPFLYFPIQLMGEKSDCAVCAVYVDNLHNRMASKTL